MLSVELKARRARQRGFSLIELLIVIAIILIILTFALPQMGKAREQAQEVGAIQALKTINQMEIQYQSQFGNYATTLAQLGPPTGSGTAEGPDAAGLIPASLAAGSTGGYNFTLTATPTGYSATAVPKVFNSTGRRTFYTDQTGVLRENWGQEAPTPTSPELGKISSLT